MNLRANPILFLMAFLGCGFFVPVFGQLKYEFPQSVEQSFHSQDSTGFGRMMQLSTGDFIVAGGPPRILHPDWSARPGFNALSFPLDVQGVDTFICVGFESETNHIVRRVTQAGADPSFNSPAFSAPTNSAADTHLINDIKVQPDGKILVACYRPFRQLVLTNMQAGLFRLQKDGPIDSTFKYAGSADFMRILVLPTGSFFAYTASGSLRRFLADGTLDNSFTEVILGGSSFDMVLDASSNLVVAGEFATVNGGTRRSLARIFPDGSVDFSFRPFPSGGDVFFRVAIQADGKIVCASANQILRVTSAGIIDGSFAVRRGVDTIADFFVDARQCIVESSSSDLIRWSAQTRATASPGGVAITIDRSDSIDTGWVPVASAPTGQAADYFDAGFPGLGSTFFRVRPTN